MITSIDLDNDGALFGLTFRPMLITDMFNVHNGSGATRKDRGATPYVAASFQNNGVVGYVDTAKYQGGWLSLVKDGDGGAGKCFYQPVPFWPSNHVLALEPKISGLAVGALLCVATLITHQCFPKYSRGNAINASRLSRQKIMVPVTTDSAGNQIVDWNGLSRLGEKLMANAKTRARNVRNPTRTDADTLPNLTFEPMLITDVFMSMKASSAWYDKSKLVIAGQGQHPFVSRTRENNGIDGTCARQKKSPEPGNAITIGLDTQTVAYQPAAFYTSQNIQVLRHDFLDVDSALFLVTTIRQQMSKFSWGGNGATLGRLQKTRIMAPVITDADGQQVVDWDGMSRYGRALRVKAERMVNVVLGEDMEIVEKPQGNGGKRPDMDTTNDNILARSA